MHPKNGRKELSTWKRGWSSSASCLPEVMYLYCVTGVDILYGETEGRCSWIHLLLLTIITTANWWWWVSCLKFLTAGKLLQNQLGAYVFVCVIAMLKYECYYQCCSLLGSTLPKPRFWKQTFAIVRVCDSSQQNILVPKISPALHLVLTFLLILTNCSLRVGFNPCYF